MFSETGNSPSTAAHSESLRQPVRSSRSLRWLNGGVHWISAFVLLYAFISNGDTNNAMTDSVAMRGEVKLGLVVGLIFLVRLIWVRSMRSGGGRWAGSSARLPWSRIRRITDWGIYIGVAASVVSGLLIAYLRPGVVLVPDGRGFTTNSAGLNFTIDAHAFISDALEWLCGFHAAYALWYWRIRETSWGKTATAWLERGASAANRIATSRFTGKSARS